VVAQIHAKEDGFDKPASGSGLVAAAAARGHWSSFVVASGSGP
jgi:hypothetical protein